MNAAFTLGAGSFASSVTLGAAYGYSMMWVPLYSFTFGIFFLAMVGQLFWVLKVMPETKGIPLEEMEEKLGLTND